MANMRGVRYPSYYDASITDETLDTELASSKSDGLMSKEDKVKLDSIKVGSSGEVTIEVKASEVVQDASHRFVSDEQINKWEQANEVQVVNANTHYEFPSVGSVNVIYKAYTEKKTYQWNEEKMAYEPLNDEKANISIIYGGNANAN